MMPGMYNHCDQGYSSGTTVCAVERNNKKLKPKAKAPKMPSLFCFCSAHLKLSANIRVGYPQILILLPSRGQTWISIWIVHRRFSLLRLLRNRSGLERIISKKVILSSPMIHRSITGHSTFFWMFCLKTIIIQSWFKKKFRMREFLFLGANIDAVETASQFGIGADRAVNYQCDSEGTALNYEVVSEAISSVRCSAPLNADWKKRIDEDYKKRGGK